MEELKPCPFCGEPDPTIYEDIEPCGTGKYNVQIYCSNQNCSLDFGWHESEEEAIEAWNTRADDKGE